MTYPPCPHPGWIWRARLDHIRDADTIAVVCDLGFYDFGTRIIRLAGLNAPEKDTPEGLAATAWVRTWFPAHTAVTDWPLVVAVEKRPDKFGARWDGVVYGSDGACLNADLIAAGHAVEWDGRGVKP